MNEKLGAKTPDDPNDFPAPFVKDNEPGSEYKPKPNDVTAALYLLLRTQDIVGGAFTCPATGQDAWDFGGGVNTALDWNNWAGNTGLREHASYSYQNPYPSRQAIANGIKLNGENAFEIPFAADMNPGSDALTKLTPRSPAKEMMRGNSPNHSREGQNVLFGDGHVQFVTTPFAGVKQDNIYTFGPSGEGNDKAGGDGIVGSPVGPDDAILLPTAKDIGLADANGDLERRWQAQSVSADEAQKLRSQMSGTFTFLLPTGRTFGKLDVTGNSMVVTMPNEKSATFQYTIVARMGDRFRCAVTSGGEDEHDVVNVAFVDAGIRMTGAPRLSGTWKRQP